MPKKMSDGAPRIDRLDPGESAPPLLNKKLIAQLQEAVEAAQRKRMPPHEHVTDTKD
jgi:hypothetical protein